MAVLLRPMCFFVWPRPSRLAGITKYERVSGIRCNKRRGKRGTSKEYQSVNATDQGRLAHVKGGQDGYIGRKKHPKNQRGPDLARNVLGMFDGNFPFL